MTANELFTRINSCNPYLTHIHPKGSPNSSLSEADRAFVQTLENGGVDVGKKMFSAYSREIVHGALRLHYGLHRDVALESIANVLQEKYRILKVSDDLIEQALDAAVVAFENSSADAIAP